MPASCSGCSALLRDEVGDTAYRSWLQSLRVERVDERRGGCRSADTLSADLDRRSLCRSPVGALARREPGDRQTVADRRTADRDHCHGRRLAPADSEGTIEPAGPPDLAEDREQLSAPLDARFTFENFIVGKPNELAHAAARRVAEACVGPEQSVPFNPLFLYGGVGLGKTHLMHAIAWHIRLRAPRRKVIYLSAEKFMYQFIRALRFKRRWTSRKHVPLGRLLMIDDVQFISGKDSTQEEFFHTFNALVDQKRQIVISADKSPSDLEGLEERMRSRLGWGLVADIHPTTYELRLGILQAKAEQAGDTAAAKGNGIPRPQDRVERPRA